MIIDNLLSIFYLISQNYSEYNERLYFMDELKKERDKYITKIFWLAFHISFIFAIPAVIGVIVGKKIDYIFNTNNKITSLILFLTFIFSWFLVFVKYNKLNKKLKEINKTIKKDQQS